MAKGSLQLLTRMNYWQLGCVWGAPVGLQGMFFGRSLADQFGVATAISAMWVGTLFVWVVSMAFIEMSGRKNALENTAPFIGKGGAFFTLIFLLFSLLNWYSLQLKSSAEAMNYLLQFVTHAPLSETLRVGALLGLLTSLISLGGVRMLTWICVIAVPVFLIFILYQYLFFPMSVPLTAKWEISIPATFLFTLSVLPGTMFLPTVFRHAKSNSDAKLGLAIAVIIVFLLETAGIWLNISPSFVAMPTSSPTLFYALSLGMIFSFILINILSANLLNIYLIAGAWETLIKRPSFPKEFAIWGLIGTSFFTFLQITSPMEFLENLNTAFLSCLCITLSSAFFIQIVATHRQRFFTRFINNTCWLIGCVVALLAQIHAPSDAYNPVLKGIGATLASFLVIMFIEEAIWATKKYLNELKH